MKYNHLYQWLYIFSIISFLILFSSTDSKGFGGSRGGGGFKGGLKGSGVSGGGSNFGRSNSYNAPSKPRSGSSFKSNAMSFAAGAAGGVAAYSLMRTMSGAYRSRPDGYYGPGYGVGETCTNNEDINGTTFGTFRCPLYGFPQNAKYCCGEYGKQYCCSRDEDGFYRRNSGHFGLIVLVIAILFLLILLWARRRRKQKDIIMVPTEPPVNQPPPFYNPPPPPMGYPPPPAGNPYGYPPPNQAGGFNPYAPPPQQFKSY